MANETYEGQKRILLYSRERIDKAGRDIRYGCDGDLRDESIKIIQNFREVHLYPLMLIKNHLSRLSKGVYGKAIVARRLKRLSTIIDKLERPSLDGESKNAIRLTRMQDVGGCRVILKSLEQLKKLQSVLEGSRSVHQIIKVDNYLEPKKSGYGGVHLVYSCFSGAETRDEWKGVKIEVQLRTELQHAWATSLEIIDILDGLNLKTSSDGYPEWREFFSIAGRLVAHREGAFFLDEGEIPALISRLNELEKALEVKAKLFKYNLAIRVVTEGGEVPRRVKNHKGMFLVKLIRGGVKRVEGTVSFSALVAAYNRRQSEQALSELAKSEADPNVMISALVSASDVRNLKRAYPNYFGSTGRFVSFLNELSKHNTSN